MAYIPVNSIELEANYHPDCDHYTLSGNTWSKTIVVITPSEKRDFSKPKNIPGLHKEPKSTKGASIPGLQKK